MKRTRAFTLIELLVVVAIIVALLAILLPSMGQAVSVAQRAVCGSNERQIGTTFLAYAADNKGMWPSAYYDGPGFNRPTGGGLQFQSLYTIGEQLALKLQDMGLAGGEVNTGAGSYIVPESERPDTPWDCPGVAKPRLFGFPWNNSGNYFNVDNYMLLTAVKNRGAAYSGTKSPQTISDPAGPLLSETTVTFDPGVSPVGNHDNGSAFTGANHLSSDSSVQWVDAGDYGTAFAGGTYQATGWILDDWGAKWFWKE